MSSIAATQVAPIEGPTQYIVVPDDLEAAAAPPKTSQDKSKKKNKRKGPNLHKEMAKEAPAGTPKSSSSYNLAGSIAPEVFDLSILPSPTKPKSIASNKSLANSAGYNATNSTPAGTGVSDSQSLPFSINREPAKSPFFQPFADTDTSFTFSSTPIVSVDRQDDARPASITSLAIDVLELAAKPQTEPTEPSPGPTIFDVLEKGCSTKTAAAEPTVLDNVGERSAQSEETNCADAVKYYKAAASIASEELGHIVDSDTAITSHDLAADKELPSNMFDQRTEPSDEPVKKHNSSTPSVVSTTSSCSQPLRSYAFLNREDQPSDTIFNTLSSWTIQETTRLHHLSTQYVTRSEAQISHD